MTEGPPRPYTQYIPEYLKESMGNWASHNVDQMGIIEHVDSGGGKLYTLKAAATPNGRYSTSTIRKFADLARRYSGGSMRFTAGINPEFVLKTHEDAVALRNELYELGFPVGGWGNHLWNVSSCAGYFHCALAATDALSVTQSIVNDLARFFDQEELPAKLTIASSGCPSSCGGSFLTDISISGIHTEIPVVTEDIKGCDLQGTAFSCPVGAIQLKTLPNDEKTIQIRENLCIGCGLCLGACAGIIFRTPELTDGHSIAIGGKASASHYGTTLGRVVVPFMPNEPPYYEKTVGVIRNIVDTWRRDARKGERIADWVERIGWEKFYEKTGLPFYHQSLEYFDLRGITTIRNGSGK